MPFWKKTPAPFDASGVVVSIYGKAECHLCEEAKAQLVALRRRYGFRLEEVDITSDPILLAEYETRLPLIWVDGHLVCKYHVDEVPLLEHIRRAAAKVEDRSKT